MVIRDQHLDAERPGRIDAGEAGDAVIDRHDQGRAAFRRQRDDPGRESVTELEAVGDHEVHRREAPGGQGAHHQGSARCAVGIEVADHEDRLPRLAMPQQQFHGSLDAVQRAHRQQALQRGRQLLRPGDAAGRVSAGEHRIERGKPPEGSEVRHAADDGQCHGALTG